MQTEGFSPQVGHFLDLLCLATVFVKDGEILFWLNPKDTFSFYIHLHFLLSGASLKIS